jgi:predicted RNase H-like HicB family nuclease
MNGIINIEYPFVIYPAEEGGYVAEIPALKGCLAQGETLEEALSELQTVEQLWLETARQHGQELPNAEAEIERVKSRLAA